MMYSAVDKACRNQVMEVFSRYSTGDSPVGLTKDDINSLFDGKHDKIIVVEAEAHGENADVQVMKKIVEDTVDLERATHLLAFVKGDANILSMMSVNEAMGCL